MAISLIDLEKVLIEEDIEGFIEIGAPEDEYSSEAKEIISSLNALGEQRFPEESVVKIISGIWGKSFELADEDIKLRVPAFQRVAKRLLAS